MVIFCIKHIVRVNTFKKFNIHFTLKYIFICINLDLIFRNYISVCPVYGESEIVPWQSGLDRKKTKILQILFLRI